MVGTRKKRSTASAAAPVPDIEDIALSHGRLPNFSNQEAGSIKSSLLSWYDSNHRVLPWRENPFSRKAEAGCAAQASEENKAYAVWVSEMMLQQTRVATVVQYYQRWMEKWPTLHLLAGASQEEVNSMWAGLGYYRRARFLLEGAQHIVDSHGGTFPRSLSELQKIPGIGNYTAGAIASIAFNQPVPVVDGNVVRVLCRLRAISANPKTSTSVKLFWALAEQLVDADRPGDLNQSLMELGATLCSSTSPSCSTCPISSQCHALSLASQPQPSAAVTDFPTKVAKPVPRNEYVAVCVIERRPSSALDDSSFLLVRRPEQGLLAGLWEFPSAMLAKQEKSSRARMAAMDLYLKKKLGLRIGGKGYAVSARQEIGENVHIFSHIKLHMSIEWLQLDASDLPPETKARDGSNLKWVHGTKLHDTGLTTGVKKVFQLFSEFRQRQTKPSSVKTANKKRPRQQL